MWVLENQILQWKRQIRLLKEQMVTISDTEPECPTENTFWKDGWLLKRWTWVAWDTYWEIAFIDSENIFLKDNTFNTNVIFWWDQMSLTGVDIVFDATLWSKQEITLTTTGAYTITFKWLRNKCNYEFIINNTVANTKTINKWWLLSTVAYDNASIVSYSSIWTTTFPVDIGAIGTYLFVCETRTPSIHISYLWTSTIF